MERGGDSTRGGESLASSEKLSGCMKCPRGLSRLTQHVQVQETLGADRWGSGLPTHRPGPRRGLVGSV